MNDKGFHLEGASSPLRFRYTNYEGVTEDRSLANVRVAFGKSDFHPELPSGYYLIGTDSARGWKERHFPLAELLQPPSTDHGLMAAGTPRSSGWAKVRNQFVADNPACKACGAKKLLNVHHVKPFHLFPDLELEPLNLVTLCETPSHNCHLMFGHLLDWKAWNPAVYDDCLRFNVAVKTRKYAE